VTSLVDRVAALLGVGVRSAMPLTGGDLSAVVRVLLADGSTVVAKGGDRAEDEADMLRAIAAAGVPAPRVLAAAPGCLVMERLPADGRLSDAWSDLGTVTRRLHAVTGARYGWPVDFAFGPVPIINTWSEDWPAFWAEQRLLVFESCLPVDLARRVARIARDLPNRLPWCPAPSLLHGDLWTGNVLVHGRRVSGLIDPACYYGDAAVDLAMLHLFGQPSAAFFDTYRAFDPGSDERLPIYQLWPALVHFRLFGKGYRPLVERTLEASGG